MADNTGLAKAWAVVPAGGSGQRFGNRDKLMVPLAGKPVLVHTVQALLSSDQIEGVVVAAHSDRMATYQEMLQSYVFEQPPLKPLSWQKPVRFVAGGRTRRDSVRRGLAALPEDVEIVLIHDAARPLISPDVVDQAAQRIRQEPDLSVLVAVPVVDTIKEVAPETGRILATVDRERLWQAQTPQVFWRKRLLQAHDQVEADFNATDDTQLVEWAGLGQVVIVPGERRNLKITTPEDILIAEALLKSFVKLAD